MKNTALITGASSGIGLELAKLHAAEKGDLILVARRRERLEALADELRAAHGVEVRVLVQDLVAPGAVEAVSAALDNENLTVDILINNAGFGGHGLFHERDWSRDQAMVQLNIVALTGLTRLLLPQMIARGSGRVLNVASMAGFLPGPLQAVYYATKAYVVSFSQAIANELQGTGVTVTALCPGATHTEFVARADMEGVNLFKNAMTAEAVARIGYQHTLAGRNLSIPGAQNRFLVDWVMPIVPRKMLIKMSRDAMEKE